jgi:hypothetical protein
VEGKKEEEEDEKPDLRISCSNSHTAISIGKITRESDRRSTATGAAMTIRSPIGAAAAGREGGGGGGGGAMEERREHGVEA